MKGPGNKTALDVRRTWRCSACGRTRKQMGDVTTMTCDCRDGGVFMSIVIEKIVAPRPFQQLSQEDVRSAAFGIDDMPVLQPHPNSLPPEPTGPRRPRPGSAESPAERNATTEKASSVNNPPDSESASTPTEPSTSEPPQTSKPSTEPDDDWGEGIL